MDLKNYPVEALHTFQVHTLRQFGYQTRVTLVNLSSQRPEFSTDYYVDVRINYPDGREVRKSDVGFILTGARIVLDCSPFLDSEFTGEAILTFSMIPVRYRDQKTVNTSRAELWFLLTAQDHYVEFYRDDGFSSGVLYQSGAFNFSGFSQERTTLIQAPKVYKDSSIETYMSVIYNGFDETSREPAILDCLLIDGERKISTWQEVIPARTMKLINISEHMLETEQLEFACLYGFCRNATLLPLTISRNKNTQCLALEHSLPPNYYASTMTGANRKQAVVNLSKFVFHI